MAHVVSQLTKSTAQATGGVGVGVKGQPETWKRQKGKQKATLSNEKIYT